jgi:molecular chaperone DnaK (HSP70)
VKINVLQGERELAADCRSLGEFDLRGIPPMPAGLPKIDVTFLIDQNGILSVTAREERSGQEASVQIVPAHGLTRDEVARMERESVEHAREDMSAHRLIDLRNQVAFDTGKTETMLRRLGAKLDRGLHERIETAMGELRRFAESSRDNDAIYKRLQEFDRLTVPLAELGVAETLKESQAVTAGNRE